MTKQKSGAEDKSSPARGRTAKTPAAPTAPVEESLAANEETVSAAEVAPEAVLATALEPVQLEAAPEVATTAASETADLPAQIVLLTSEAETFAREEALAFSWSSGSLDFWRENAKALYRLAEELGAARTPSQIVEAQTKFAVEQLRAFGRHAETIAAVRVKFFFAA
jgi:hypothetical protein